MKFIHMIRTAKQKWNSLVTKQLRKVGIFKRLNISFLVLLLISALFLTFFSFFQYSREINLNLTRYTSMLVQNTRLKIQDTMEEYENMALNFYNDSRIIRAISENSALPETRSPGQEQLFQTNTFLIENRLYSLRQNKKHIVNIQFVTPSRQYHMVEDNGFQRGGTIRDLDAFYKSDFYLVPQDKRGYPVWMDDKEQTGIFYKNEQVVYGFANIITMEIAVYEPNTRDFLGILLFNIDRSTFSDIETPSGNNDQGNIFLIGKSGVLTWFDPSIKSPSFPRIPELFEEMLQKRKSIEQIQLDRQNILLAYEQIPDTEMFACYIASLDALLAHSYHIRNLCVLVLIGTVIACFILSYYVTFSISDPLKKLNQVMKKTGSGKWTARYENSGHDEITALGDRFNEMAENTNQLIDQVYLSEIHRQKLQLSWKNAQLDAMLMQINPHFLYNTLDIIRWEAMYEADGESPVTEMIEKFSRLCRLGMKTGSNTITLKEGIEHASIYLDVINFRHSEKIQLFLETEVDDQSVYIPQFILQPIMENAVVHAFGDASSGYFIRIHSSACDNVLHILVEDNGRGMEKNELHSLQLSLNRDEAPDESIGLVNVNQRIRLFYGESYGLQISSTPGKGTRIEILLPLRNHSENMTDITGGTDSL
ncbi:sensor histidine kinase [Blautia sp.]|jgi:sensor histidine kinase YesM|uniref:sensor histidine kinase n=1 Tax=Blautia sp. TaxID=1955243 RepID=UPI003D8FD7FD